MKTIKRIQNWINSKINQWVIKRFIRIAPVDIVNDLFKKMPDKHLTQELYKKFAEGDMHISTKVIEVKKGKLRYTLLIVKDRNLQTVFNLGRHQIEEPIVSERDNINFKL